MSGATLTIVDVFAEKAWAGNQLAVVFGAGEWEASRMQAFAREMNFSETTFVRSTTPREGGYDVRIFTPAEELPFAGHPTLGTAWTIRRFVLGGKGDALTLHLGVGAVPVRFDGELVWMKPRAPQLGPVRDAAAVAVTLGIAASDVDDAYPCQDVSVGVEFVLLPLRSLDALRAVKPAAVPSTQSGRGTGAFCFCRGAYDDGGDVAARMFFEAAGLREDPATGSANACLAAYLSAHRYLGSEQVSARVQQGYEMERPSTLYLRARTPEKVEVGGKVVLVARGEIA